MTPEAQEAWREMRRKSAAKYRETNLEKGRDYSRKWREANLEKAREIYRKWREENPKKAREACRKTYCKLRQKAAADQFFILAGAAESISKLKLKSESK